MASQEESSPASSVTQVSGRLGICQLPSGGDPAIWIPTAAAAAKGHRRPTRVVPTTSPFQTVQVSSSAHPPPDRAPLCRAELLQHLHGGTQQELELCGAALHQPLHHHSAHSTRAAELLAGTQHTPPYLWFICFITLLYLCLLYTAFVTQTLISLSYKEHPCSTGVQGCTAGLQAMPAWSPLVTQQHQARPHTVLAALSGNPPPDGCICK